MITNQYVRMAYPNSTIYNHSSKGIEQLDSFATELYEVTHDFLVNPRRMLDRLLDTPPQAPVRRISNHVSQSQTGGLSHPEPTSANCKPFSLGVV